MKTICEQEFDKWINDPKINIPVDLRLFAQQVWNISWKTCGKKILDEFNVGKMMEVK